MEPTLASLRRHAIASSLFKPTTLGRAIERLGFVQADPIRSPARAQDLILRHRVKDYHAGDLEARYPKLDLEEDFVYAYGFVPKSTWQLLHPRISRALTAAEERVLTLVSTHRQMHPRELEVHLGREREVNAWGGYSKATTRTLQTLHYRGLLRVSKREQGIRIYKPAGEQPQLLPPSERLRKLVLLIAAILAPVPERSLRATLRHLGYAAPDLEGRHSAVKNLIASGDLSLAEVEGLRYVWPTGKLIRKPPEPSVRFLAPFDPIVWDRRRFEHFWGWTYRFEAYTPEAKRKLGYYAMPMLWLDRIIGWVNIARKAKSLTIESGFVDTQPKTRAFREAFDAEVNRFEEFLK